MARDQCGEPSRAEALRYWASANPSELARVEEEAREEIRGGRVRAGPGDVDLSDAEQLESVPYRWGAEIDCVHWEADRTWGDNE